MKKVQLHYSVLGMLMLCIAIAVLPAASTQTLAAAEHSEDSTASSRANNMLFLPVAYNKFSCASATDGPFGVQMYSNSSASSPYFGDMRCTGANWVRADLDWKRVEPENTTPENYSWGAADASAGAARDAGISMILTLEEAPGWAAASENGPLKAGMNAELAEFMKAVVERYDGDGTDDAAGIVIRHFEIYNEPDAGILGGGGQTRWGNDGDKYAEMLSVVYPAIKEADADARVLFGGIAYDWFTDWSQDPNVPFESGPFVRNFLTDVLDAGGGQYFDIFAFHQYPSFAPAWTTNGGVGLAEKTEALKEVLASYNLTQPIMITEAGQNSLARSDSTVDGEEIQARHVLALYTQAISEGILSLIWFSLYDLPAYSVPSGIVTEDGQHKQAVGAYQTAVAKLGRANFQRQLTDAETGSALIEAYLFTRSNGQQLYVAWINPVFLDGAATLTVPASGVTVQDLYGEDLTQVTDAADGTIDGQVTVGLSGQPRYFVVQ